MLQLVVAEAGKQSLVELHFARSLPHHHRVSHAGLAEGGAAEELHVMQVERHFRSIVVAFLFQLSLQ